MKIEDEIKKKKEELANVEGTECEVHARIVGYYRAVKNWNKGKRDEYNNRAVYKPTPVKISEFKLESVVYFYQPSCPNCLPVKQYLEEIKLKHRAINALEHQDEARRYSIMSTPTVLFLDENKIARYRCYNMEQIKEVIGD